MLKTEPPFREQKNSGMIRIPVADTLGQESVEREKKKKERKKERKKKKSPLSLMNNNKQRHLVATLVYLGVGLTVTSPPSSMLIIKQAGKQKFIFPVAT